MILNDGTLVVSESTKTVEVLRQVLEHILKTYYSSNNAPDYDKIRMSEDYNALINSVRLLQIFNPSVSDDHDQKKAFWINLYNTLTVHAIIHFQIKLTVWERPNFFFAAEYNVGGYRFSLFDIAHGILRGNRKRWWYFPPPFRGHDPRIRFSIDTLDPRIHFALHSGSRSCPELAIYHPEDIDNELDDAVRRFVNSRHFIYDQQARVLSCSKIFKWFAKDFGNSKSERILYFAKYVENDSIKSAMQEEASSISVKYVPYDWHLNSSE